MQKFTAEALADAERARYFTLEARLLSELSDVFEAALQIRWPEMAGGDERVMDAIRDNLPFSEPKWPPYESLDELFAIQRQSRLLMTYNEFAHGAARNRRNYIIGTGHVVTPTAAPGATLTESEVAEVSAILESFRRRNRWRSRSRATQLRLDRDGEVFIRYFVEPDGLSVRFVEPERVSPPRDMAMSHPWGIVYSEHDVERVEGYFIDEQFVPAADVQHRKLGDDFGCPRGVPLFMVARGALCGAATIQRNVTALSKIQSAIALLRKHRQATVTAIQNFVANKADVSVENPLSGKTEYGAESRPGKVIDTTDDVEYEFPSAGTKPVAFLGVKESVLRAAAAAIVMPEFMFTADASNANLASTQVADAPATREFECAQYDAIEYDEEVFDRVLDTAVAQGILSEDVRRRVIVRIEAPTPAVKDRLKEAQARQIDRQLGVSPQTLIQESGRDPSEEMLRNAEWEEQSGGIPGAALPTGVDPDMSQDSDTGT